jgi:hypothetical protein
LGEGKEIAVKRIYFTIGFIVRGQKEREGFFCQCGDFRADFRGRRVIRGYGNQKRKIASLLRYRFDIFYNPRGGADSGNR